MKCLVVKELQFFNSLKINPSILIPLQSNFNFFLALASLQSGFSKSYPAHRENRSAYLITLEITLYPECKLIM